MFNLKIWIKETGKVEKVTHYMKYSDEILVNREYVVGKDCNLILNGVWVDSYFKVSGFQYEPYLNTKVGL